MTACDAQFDSLRTQLAQLCGMVGTSMESATEALLQGHLVLAERVIGDHEAISLESAAAEESGLCLLGSAAPVTQDPRAVVGCIQIITDIDRMAALSLHVAQIARLRHPGRALPEQVNGYFAEMGRIAVELADSARYVIASGDPGIARSIRADDDAMDDLHRHLFTLMMDREWKHGVAAAIDMALLGRYYERFGDHAVKIARRVIFDGAARPSVDAHVSSQSALVSRRVS